MIHSVDFHAATGSGGGAASTQVEPGDEKSFKFKALVPGLYVYHCATPMVAHHIANGMYGLILVEPEGDLPPADREFYVMQGEIYTDAPFGQAAVRSCVEKLPNEHPEYFVFNRFGRRAVHAASASGQGGRNRPHPFRSRWAKLHVLLPRDITDP